MDCPAGPPEPTALATVQGIVLQHGGLESELSGPTTADRFVLRVMLKPGADGERNEIQFVGYWAARLATLEPGDGLTVEGAEVCARTEWRVPPESEARVTISRSGREAELDYASVCEGRIPAWLHLPGVKKVGGAYQYIRFLSTLRDGIDVNLYAVVWENAKPGPKMASGLAVKNFLVVDRSFDHLPFTGWSATAHVPQFSLQLSMSILPEEIRGKIPYLTVGDVIRVHRFGITSRPPRFVNIRQQKLSSLVVFRTPEQGSELQAEAITEAREHTITEADRQQAQRLQQWIRSRLSRETVSSYLVNASELAGIDGSRDLVVQVLQTDPSDMVLIASDGSTSEKLRVDVSEPLQAANWLFAYVQPGHWLKLRNVFKCDGLFQSGGDETDSNQDTMIPLRVSAEVITRLPTWCLDVVERVQRMRDRGISVEAEQARAARAPPGERRADPGAGGIQTDTVVDAEEEDTRDSSVPCWNCPTCNTSNFQATCVFCSTRRPEASASSHAAETAGAVDLLREGARVVVVGLQMQPALNGRSGILNSYHRERQRWLVELDSNIGPKMLKPANLAVIARSSASRSSASSVHEAEPQQSTAVVGAASEPAPRRKLHFTSAYGDAASASRISQVRPAAAHGTMCHVIGKFSVDRAESLQGIQATRAEDLLCASCSTCGHCYVWCQVCADTSDAREAKRRRLTLPCGHWMFHLVFKFLLQLRDVEDRRQSLSVSVCDESGELFGVAPDEAGADSAARQRVQQLLDALLNNAAHGEHALAVVRVDGPGCPAGAYIVCDSKLELVDMQ
mmetsp:Transcript_107465/g.190378  ORF Transcript_107465/g.190378 Transcript_107465/m.190378 type:complete len:794 (-) Transcript_107465:59-2440(-)